MKLFLHLAMLIALASLVFPFSTAFSKIGVGVGTGKIVVDERLKPGIIYQLPPITVFNTGDESSEYGIGVAYHQDQPELMPAKEWFSFNPEAFYLEPGEAQTVEIRLNLPVKTTPGDYFAYVEGFPKTKSESGTASIGVAAAAKLYFTVDPANIFAGIYYRALSIWNQYPYPISGALGIILIGALYKYASSKFSLDIRKKESDPAGGSAANEPKTKYNE
jgi:hypothetical protein